MYNEADYLMLSGLQHFTYCRRRWALIHIEQLWAENCRTVDGALMHQNAHDSSFTESRGDLLITRGVNIHSARLGVTGQCDVLEFRRDPAGVSIPGREGRWQPYPVEYKRGSPNSESGDALQLCGQAMCLEEMLCCAIPEGALFYGETRHRTVVAFTPELRSRVKSALEEMHDLFHKGYTPTVKPKKGCNACSLKELCLPKLMKSPSVHKYLHQSMEDQT